MEWISVKEIMTEAPLDYDHKKNERDEWYVAHEGVSEKGNQLSNFSRSEEKNKD